MARDAFVRFLIASPRSPATSGGAATGCACSAGLLILRGILGGTAALLLSRHQPPAGRHRRSSTTPRQSSPRPSPRCSSKKPWLRHAGGPGRRVVRREPRGLRPSRALGGGYLWLAIGLFSACSRRRLTPSAPRVDRGAWEVFLAVCIVGALFNAPLALHGWKTPTSGGWALLGPSASCDRAQLLLTHALAAVEAATPDHQPAHRRDLAGSRALLRGTVRVLSVVGRADPRGVSLVSRHRNAIEHFALMQLRSSRAK